MSGRSFYTFNNINEYFGRQLPVVPPYQKGTIAFWGKAQVGQLHHRAFVLGGDGRFYFIVGIDGTLNAVKTGSDGFNVKTTTALTDDGIWHHFVIAIDTTLVDQTERCRIYLDGTECAYADFGIDYPIEDTPVLDRSAWYINNPFYAPWLGYLDKFYFVDNAQLTPASFISGTPGGPIPFTGNYGAAGFFLDFDDASSPTTMGYDTSGHNFNFTPYNLTVANNSSTDVPGIGLATGGLAVSAPVIGTADFNSGAIAANLVAGSPQLSSATIGSAAPNSLTISSPVLGKPGIVMHGKNVLSAAVSLDKTQPPVFGSPHVLSFVSVTLEAGWGVTGNAIIGGPFIDAKPSYDAVALIEKGGTTGPYELYRSIAREAKVDVYRLMFDVAPTGGGRYVEIGLTDDSVGGVSATFDPETGECLVRNPLVVGSALVQSDWKLIGVEADPLLNHYYRLQIVAQVRAVASIRAYIRLIDENLDADYSSDGMGSVFVSDPRLLWSWDKRQFRWEIGPPEMRFYWTAHLSSLGLRWFRCGQGELGVDHHLEFINAPDLECVYRRWQPAQDELVFDYSGYLVAGTGNPMEGTP